MEFTSMGGVLIPMGLLAWVLGIDFLLVLAVIVSVFQASSVLNFISPINYSLSPYYFVCLLIASRMLLTWRTDAWLAPLRGSSGKFFRRLLYFALWSTFSAFALPLLFEGVAVYNPRIGVDDQYYGLTPLVWSLANLSQIIYLWLNVLVLLAVWYCGENETLLQRIRRSFQGVGLIVILLGLYQKGCIAFGWLYPVDFLYSNLQLQISEDLGGATRLSSTFSEPSLFSAFLVAYILFVINQRAKTQVYMWLKSVLLLLAGVNLVWSEASTGYATFVLIFAGLIFFRVIKPLLAHGRIDIKWLLVIVTLLIGMGVVAIYMGDTIDRVLFQKGDSLSAVYRWEADWYAVQLFFETGGLGVGLGSNRPSSFLTFLLSTVGLPGTFLFFSIVGAQTGMLAHARKKQRNINESDIDAATWSWFGVLLSMSIAIPDIASQLLWVMWIMLLVSIRQVIFHIR